MSTDNNAHSLAGQRAETEKIREKGDGEEKRLLVINVESGISLRVPAGCFEMKRDAAERG